MCMCVACVDLCDVCHVYPHVELVTSISAALARVCFLCGSIMRRSSIIGLILVKELLQYKTHQEVPVSDVRMRSLPR